MATETVYIDSAGLALLQLQFAGPVKTTAGRDDREFWIIRPELQLCGVVTAQGNLRLGDLEGHYVKAKIGPLLPQRKKWVHPPYRRFKHLLITVTEPAVPHVDARRLSDILHTAFMTPEAYHALQHHA